MPVPLLANTFRSWSEKQVYYVLCVLGLVSGIVGAFVLHNFSFNFGKPLVGVFVAPILTVSYLVYCGFRETSFDLRIFKRFVLLFFIQVVPFVPIFLQVYEPTPGDDLSRYLLFAENMLENNTLWGGDQLYFNDAGLHYVIQPGYRYYLYFELLLFGKLSRAVQFFDILVLLVSMYHFTSAVVKGVADKRVRLMILSLLLLMLPALVKNLLLGLPEWLTGVILMWCCYFFVVRKNVLIAVFFLGLAPFFRQNLLVGCVLLALFILVTNRAKLLTLAVFILPLLLPLYHNVYYAKEWRLLVDVFRLPFLTYQEPHAVVTGVNYQMILSNLLHYVGLDRMNGSFMFSLIGFLFLPFSVFLFFKMTTTFSNRLVRLFFIVTVLSVALPVVFLGSAYYPRFELMNVLFMVAVFMVYSCKLWGSKTSFVPHLKFNLCDG